MRARRLLAMSLVVAPLLLASCTAEVDTDEPPVRGSLATYPKPNSGMDALLSGTLTIHDDCVAIAQSDRMYLPMFPEGDASWNEGVLTWHDEQFIEGDTIAVGGGLTHPDQFDSSIPAGCDDLELFAVSP